MKYKSTSVYSKGDLAEHNGVVYKALRPSSGVSPDNKEYWVEDGKLAKIVEDKKASSYISGNAYEKGAIVTKDGKTYKALKANASIGLEDKETWILINEVPIVPAKPKPATEYDSTKQYTKGDYITVNGVEYVALKNSLGSNPPSDSWLKGKSLPVQKKYEEVPEEDDSKYIIVEQHGFDGKDGKDGRDGKQGPQGIQGEKGDTGIQGPQGPRGERGADGDTGPRGPQGPKGEKGDPGPIRDRFVIGGGGSHYILNSAEGLGESVIKAAKRSAGTLKKLKAGANVTLTSDDDSITIASSGGGGSGGHTIQDEGIDLTARTNLNFVGSGVTVTDDAGNDATVVTIPQFDISTVDTDDVAEGSTNLYFTNERAQDAVGTILTDSASVDFTYNDAGNTITATVIQAGIDHGSIGGLADDDHTQYHTDARALTWLGTRSTTDLPEGSNLYFTNERVDDRVAALIQNGTGISWTYDDTANTLTGNVSITQYTDEMAQDAIGAMVDSTLVYTDGTPLLSRAALTGDITASAGSNATTLATVNANVGSFTNASITVNAKGLITAASSGTAPATEAFKTISVSGQSDVVADSATDTLTLVGTGITITTNATTDTITFASTVPTTITVANEATDTTCFPLFVTAATGDLGPKSNANLTFNSNTASLGCTTFVGALTGNASTATALATARAIGGVNFDGTAAIVPQTIESANEATDTTCFPLFITASGTQQLQPKNNTALTFNSNTGALGATTLGGLLTTANQSNITGVGTLTSGNALAIVPDMVGDSGSGGTHGLVPAPASGDAAANKFLKADGTWSTVAGGSYTDEEAQDAVGTILTDTATIDFTYSDATPSITADIKATSVTNAMLAGSIAASKLVGTDIATVGTITSGTWSATTIAVDKGGTGQTSYTNGQLLIGNTTGNTLTKATLTAPAAGISITNGTGSITFALTNDLSAVEGLSSNGIATRTATDTWTVRTITGGGGITVSNGDGVSGNPTLSISNLRTLWIPAAAMRPSSSGGCAALALVAVAANQPDVSSLDFDSSTAEYAQFSVAFPKGWDEGTVTARFHWSHASTSTNFGVRWGLQGVALSDDDALGTAYGTAQEVTDTGGTTNDLYISPTTSAITIAGTPAVGDQTFFRVYRDPANGADTMAIDARLMGITLFYTINTLDDT